MRNATASRKLQGEQVVGSAVHGVVLHGLRAVEDDEIAGFGARGPFVLHDVCRALQLQSNAEILRAVQPYVPRGSLDNLGIGAQVDSMDSTYGQRSYPALEALAIGELGVVMAAGESH
jgi:hypothetical protein